MFPSRSSVRETRVLSKGGAVGVWRGSVMERWWCGGGRQWLGLGFGAGIVCVCCKLSRWSGMDFDEADRATQRQ